MLASWEDLAQYRGRLALVDGAFDPLHAGHVAYLRAAAEFGPLCCAVAADSHIEVKGRPALLPAASRAAVVDLCRGVQVTTIKDRPTEELLAHLRPTYYIKGKDWEGKLPTEQVDTCARLGISIVYLPTVSDSSSERLSRWLLQGSEMGLERLEAWTTPAAPLSHYDAAYWGDGWRAEGNVYTLEKRREIEGKHPDIIAEVFEGCSVLDYGCGPGFLVQMLRERGVRAWGYEPSVDVPLTPGAAPFVDSVTPHRAGYDAIRFGVVVCREVLEHIRLGEIAETVRDLFALSERFVYLTTRFHPAPLSVFDVTDEPQVDPSHCTLLTQPFLRALCVLNGGKRRRDLEERLDWQHKGRVLVYEVTR